MATLDILTLEEAKEAINKVLEDTSDDEIQKYITAVSKRLDELCGPIVRRPVIDQLSGGTEEIFLTRYPVSSITSVVEYSRGVGTTLTPVTNTSSSVNGYQTFPYSRDHTLKGNCLARRRMWDAARFEPGVGNIEVSYTAGRFADTASVSEKFKRAAGFMMLNYWRSQEDSAGGVGEFYVPQSYFPRWAIPNVVSGLLENEIQEPEQFVATGE